MIDLRELAFAFILTVIAFLILAVICCSVISLFKSPEKSISKRCKVVQSMLVSFCTLVLCIALRWNGLFPNCEMASSLELLLLAVIIVVFSHI